MYPMQNLRFTCVTRVGRLAQSSLSSIFVWWRVQVASLMKQQRARCEVPEMGNNGIMIRNCQGSFYNWDMNLIQAKKCRCSVLGGMCKCFSVFDIAMELLFKNADPDSGGLEEDPEIWHFQQASRCCYCWPVNCTWKSQVFVGLTFFIILSPISLSVGHFGCYLLW